MLKINILNITQSQNEYLGHKNNPLCKGNACTVHLNAHMVGKLGSHARLN